MSKFCKKCGAEMRDEAEFCPRCGTAQSVQNVQTSQSINQVGNTYSPNTSGNTYAPNQVSSSGSSSNETIIIAVVAVLVVAIGAFFVVFNGNVDEIKEALHMGPKQETKVDTAASAPTQTAPAPSSAQQSTPDQKPHNTGVITGTEVRMRVGPGTHENIIGYFEKGESVEILEVRPGWAKVKRTNGAIGWVSDQFCKY